MVLNFLDTVYEIISLCHMIINFARRSDLNCTVVNSSKNGLVCLLAMAHKLPFVASNSRSIKPFQLMYANLWTSPIISAITTKYFLLLVDDHTKYMWIFFFIS